MSVDMIRVFIGYDPVEAAAYHTLCHSIMRHSSRPVSITPIHLGNLRAFHDRERDPLQSNAFAFTRWLVPFLCNYEGRAIFMDADMLVTDDVAHLWDMADPEYAVQVVKHNHVPHEQVKFLGTPQSVYDKKNWSSVMLFNNAKCTALTPEYVNTAHGLDLHQFKWLSDDNEIGELPMRWNFLVGYHEKLDVKLLSNLHFTIGGPYFHEYKSCDYAKEWWDEFFLMTYTAQTDAAPVHKSEVSVQL